MLHIFRFNVIVFLLSPEKMQQICHPLLGKMQKNNRLQLKNKNPCGHRKDNIIIDRRLIQTSNETCGLCCDQLNQFIKIMISNHPKICTPHHPALDPINTHFCITDGTYMDLILANYLNYVVSQLQKISSYSDCESSPGFSVTWSVSFQQKQEHVDYITDLQQM